MRHLVLLLVAAALAVVLLAGCPPPGAKSPTGMGGTPPDAGRDGP